MNAYVATYSPEEQAGYYAVTTDQGMTLASVAAARSNTKATAGHQTVLVFSRYSASEIETSLADIRRAVEAVQADAAFYYDPAIDGITLTVDAEGRSGRFVLPTTVVDVRLEAGVVSDLPPIGQSTTFAVDWRTIAERYRPL
ncbi:MAG: hypothetical protein Q4G67_11110 [Actinomycetia bacterium]|nr:hypothetical protein [Actinomycetes bacterium]